MLSLSQADEWGFSSRHKRVNTNYDLLSVVSNRLTDIEIHKISYATLYVWYMLPLSRNLVGEDVGNNKQTIHTHYLPVQYWVCLGKGRKRFLKYTFDINEPLKLENILGIHFSERIKLLLKVSFSYITSDGDEAGYKDMETAKFAKQ